MPSRDRVAVIRRQLRSNASEVMTDARVIVVGLEIRHRWSRNRIG